MIIILKSLVTIKFGRWHTVSIFNYYLVIQSLSIPYENNVPMVLLPSDISKTCIPAGGSKQTQKDMVMF